MKSRKKSFAEKIINILLNILIFIFGIILLISIYTSIQTKLLGNAYTNFFGYSLFEVQTGSMSNTINAGDWIIVRLTEKVRLNDIVTYKAEGEFITHRVVEVYKGTYVTKGDANNAKDDPIDQNQIVGKVVKIFANFGIVRKTIFNPGVLIVLIVTLFLFDSALKKNKKTADKTKTSKFNKDVIIKKVKLFVDSVVKKIKFLVREVRKIKNHVKPKRIIEKISTPEVENKDFESYKNVYNFEKLKELAPKAEVEEYYKDEDDLSKTSLFRVVPVDANEVGDKFKVLPTKAEVEEHYKDEDELDKTSLYRMIPVDANEVDDTLLEIAKNELKEAEQKGKNEEKAGEPEPKQEQEPKTEPEQEIEKEGINQEETEKAQTEGGESLTNINLSLLKDIKSSRKSKNVIDTAVLIQREELVELINILVEDNKNHVNVATIKDMFINAYIDARYYNYYDNKDVEYSSKSLILKIEKVIKEAAIDSELINNGDNNDTKYSDTVDLYTSTLILIANLEQAKNSITDLRAKKGFYKKEIKKHFKDWDNDKIEYVIEELTKVQKKYADTLEYFLRKLETNMFDLSFNKLTAKNEMYGLELKHNIAFSKVYSDYIVDKTYTEGIVAEDKMEVLLTLLSVQLVKDMTLSNFSKEYILYIPESLYTKEKKFEKLLKIIDDKYAKDNVFILITFEELIRNEQIVKQTRRMGYRFALVFDKEPMIEEEKRGDIYIADYIFINKKIIDVDKITPYIPKELLDKIIYEDIVNKIGDFGGEKL